MPKPKPGPSDCTAELLAFAQKHRKKPGIRCRTCSLPHALRDAVEAARERLVPYHLISRFLAEKGHEIGDTTLLHHFRSGHQQ